MADEWWSASQRSHGSSACSAAAPLVETAPGCGWASPGAAPAAESTSSVTFQDPQYRSTHLQPLSDAASSLGDVQMDWTQAFLSGRSDTSFQALIQDDMAASAGHLFRAQTTDGETAVLNNPPFRVVNMGGHGSFSLLDQVRPAAAAPSSPYGTTLSQQGMFDAAALPPPPPNVSMFGGGQSSPSYDGATASMQGGGSQLQQYLSGSCYHLPFGAPLSPQLLLQALHPMTSCSSNSRTPMTKSAQNASCSSVARKSAPAAEATPAAKRPRIEAPSPMPTFKVRKEKLGDRITALQQLVSPFGKTDTASVLHEANEYIKFLHDQVASLTSPYLKNVMNPLQQFQQKGSDHGAVDSDDGGGGDEVPKKDLRSRGLCLVPVAATYTVASETVPEFWHPTFGGTFR